ncbi:MFS transporter [Streptomyces mexicanus]
MAQSLSAPHQHTATAAGTRRADARRHGVGFSLIAFAFLTAMAFSTVPTPLYPLYMAKDGFSTFMVTVVFATYAVGVVISLVLAGHLSDRVGRKKVLLPAIGLELVAAVLFLTSTALPVLLAARLLTGLGVGMVTATATAHLQELHTAHRPGASLQRFELVSTAANIGGLGVGPLVAGLLAQWVSGPLRTPYLVFAVLLLVSVVAIALTPETVEEQSVRPPTVPSASRSTTVTGPGSPPPRPPGSRPSPSSACSPPWPRASSPAPCTTPPAPWPG